MDGREPDDIGAHGQPVEGSQPVERRSPAAVFKLLASETRVEILEALGDPPGTTRSFSALFDAVEMRDSGNFTYHLNELLGTFVRKQDEEYRLTHAGEQVVGSIHAGTYTTEAAIESTRTGDTCQLCGGALVFEYADETARVYCEDCGKGRTFSFPPGCLSEYDSGELPAVSARWYRTHVQRILDGFCPLCAGRMAGELSRGVRTDRTPPEPALATFECERCGNVRTVSAATIATFHPVVEGFLFEHGFDPREGPHSTVWEELDDSAERERSTDPLTVEVAFTHGGETVVTTVGPDATVTSVQRKSATRD